MLESLTTRLGAVAQKLRGTPRLNEKNIAEALEEVRKALLGADVDFKLVGSFTEAVQQRIIGQKLTENVSAGDALVKCVHDALVELLGTQSHSLSAARPLRIMLVGLQGSGKTTTAVKIAHHFAKSGARCGLVACDIYRPAAIDQLETLAQTHGFPVFANRETQDVAQLAKQGLARSQKEGWDVTLFDMAGRLELDASLMEELTRTQKAVGAQEVLLVVDAALGQQAVEVAEGFHKATELSGIVLTKFDGDARGGAALSMKACTKVPVVFMGTGEQVEQLEVFHPDRLARRILGMGDVVSLVEKAQEQMGEEAIEALSEKVRKAEFDFEDFLSQMQKMKKMGPLGSLMKMMPGMGSMEFGDKQERQLKSNEALILSMTPKERRRPKVIDASRRKRIARGAGLEVRHLNQLLKQFTQMKNLMKPPKGKKAKALQAKLGSMGENLPDNMRDLLG